VLVLSRKRRKYKPWWKQGTSSRPAFFKYGPALTKKIVALDVAYVPLDVENTTYWAYA
jgi:hypothetical protein